MSIQKHGFGIIAVLLVGAWAGCELMATNQIDPPQEDARIVPPDSVEGISLGASKQEVEAILGSFKTRVLADGSFRNWWVVNFFTSEQSSSDGLALFFIEEVGHPIDDRVGPLDAFSIRAPYDGRTKEGIGIGSSPASVLEAYGEPVRGDTTGGPGVSPRIRYTYCFSSGRYFTISFIDDAVTGMGVGLFRPVPGLNPFCD